MANSNKQINQPNGKMRKPKFNFNWLYLLLLLGIGYAVLTKSSGEASKQLSYTDFRACLDSGYVKEILVNKDNLTLRFAVTPAGEKYIYGNVAKDKRARVPEVEFGSVSHMEEQVDAARKHGRFMGKISYEREDNTLWTLLLQIGPLILFVVLWFFIMNRMSGGGAGGGIFSFGKSKAKLFDQAATPIKTTFKDVAGQTEAKREVHEIVDFLKNPAKYTELGGKIPKGALLVGPPGTGKTLLAKAVAGEAGVPFFSMSGSDFVEMFVGVGASRVRDLFQQAKEKAPCIVFIDEIDAIGRARGNKVGMGGNDERENTLNQLLTEMDGFGTNSGIIILAATNRAEVLDKALLRAGRFDRQIHVDLPDLNERKAIFNVHLRPIKIDETVDVDTLARQTPGFSGADIANVCNEAALIAARKNSSWVNKQCFLDAVDRIIGGLEKKTKVMTAAEKRAIALHEAGHATVSWFCQYANPLVKVTIVPRGQALGAAWYMPEERQITTKEEILDEICATLGGRAAEDVCLGRISTGAMNDLEKVTKRSYGMIAYAGMSDSLPNLCYYNNDEYAFAKPYSDHTAELIDAAVKTQIAEQYERAKQILIEHKEGHEELAQLLIDNEVIYAEDVERIFGKRPWVSRTEEILAANAEVQNNGDDSMDHSAENEEFIRKKVVDAVVEKAKNGEMTGGPSSDTNTHAPSAEKNDGTKTEVKPMTAPVAEKKEPMPFRELKVTTFEAVAAAAETLTEPTLTEPTVTEPVATEPIMTEPEVTEPIMTEPIATEPIMTEPEVTEPIMTAPEVAEPAMTETAVAADPIVADGTEAMAEDGGMDAAEAVAQASESEVEQVVTMIEPFELLDDIITTDAEAEAEDMQEAPQEDEADAADVQTAMTMEPQTEIKKENKQTVVKEQTLFGW